MIQIIFAKAVGRGERVRGGAQCEAKVASRTRSPDSQVQIERAVRLHCVAVDIDLKAIGLGSKLRVSSRMQCN